MKDYIKIAQINEKIIHKYNRSEKIKIDYGTGQLLTREEIHTISIIGMYDNINLTTLSIKQGVTKGASSQMVKRLVLKGLVLKEPSANSETEILLKLTFAGAKAFEGHMKFHSKQKNKWKKILEDMSQ